MKILCIPEFEICHKKEVEIAQLLDKSFKNFPSQRSYYKQLPRFRILASIGKELIGHMALEYRVITVNGIVMKVFGIIDLCIKESYRDRGIGSKLLKEIERLTVKSKYDAVILFADDHRLYEQNGFKVINCICTWHMIDEHKTLGIKRDTFDNCLMIKMMNGKEWPGHDVDLLGYMF